MVYNIEMACVSHMGYIRENNEDNFCFGNHILSEEHGSMSEPLKRSISTREIEAVAVFDGMGGENAGEAASYAAAGTFRERCRIPDMTKSNVLNLIRELNREVCMKADREKLGQIGCTATVLFFYLQYMYLANVGDSPAYILRNGKLKLISQKHTDEEFLKQSNAGRRKPSLTQFLGIPGERMILEPYLVGIEIQSGDIFLICTDGLTDMVSDEKIKNILKGSGDVCKMADNLLGEALLAGGCDNTTIICGRVCQ